MNYRLFSYTLNELLLNHAHIEEMITLRLFSTRGMPQTDIFTKIKNALDFRYVLRLLPNKIYYTIFVFIKNKIPCKRWFNKESYFWFTLKNIVHTKCARLLRR